MRSARLPRSRCVDSLCVIRMDFLEELNSSVLCGDGAMGTELMSSGVPLDVCFEELNVSAPEIVSRIHDSYVQAGARLIETNTFGANAARLSKHGLQGRVQELNQAAIRLARKSIGQRPIYLAASIGPLGIADPRDRITRHRPGRPVQRTSAGDPGSDGGCAFPGDLRGFQRNPDRSQCRAKTRRKNSCHLFDGLLRGRPSPLQLADRPGISGIDPAGCKCRRSQLRDRPSRHAAHLAANPDRISNQRFSQCRLPPLPRRTFSLQCGAGIFRRRGKRVCRPRRAA